MSRHVFVVMTNPVAGRERDFNAWYDDRHLADILAIPGLVSSQRFGLSAAQNGDTPYGYLALYEIDTDDIAATVATLRGRLAAGDIPMSPALDPSLLATFFTPITPVVTARSLMSGQP